MAEQQGQKRLALADIRQICGIDEEMDFDAPFSTFSWAHWQELQAHMLFGFGRFQRAIANHQPQLAAFIVLEMQQMVMDMQKEVCSWLEPGKKQEQ